jgi:hypothetical protein
MERSAGPTLRERLRMTYGSLFWNSTASLLQCQELHQGPTCSAWGGS